MSDERSAVKVMVRVRPFSKRELGDNKNEYPMSIIQMDGSTKVQFMDPQGALIDNFEFHQTYWSIPENQEQYSSAPFVDQEGVFEGVGKNAVEDALKGYHTCIFAYGQTGSGKTHTMLGSDEDPGLAPRLVEHLYTRLAEEKATNYMWDYSIDISFMEIYNEKVKDLLLKGEDTSTLTRRKSTRKSTAALPRKDSVRQSITSPATPGQQGGQRKSAYPGHEGDGSAYQELRVRSSPSVGIFVEGLTRLGEQQGITSAEDVIDTMRAGMEQRTTAATAMNDTSSRSHAVFQICLSAKNPSSGVQRYAHINIVDLAGSERIKMSKVEGQNLKEATKINLSLSTLRRVIDVLIDNSKRKRGQPKQVAPYRDSMLTWILSESLGGNSKTMMIATVSPAESNREDSLNTLRYALKAKAIVNNVRVNEAKSAVMMSGMQREMEMLRSKLNDPEAQRSEQEIKELETQQEDLQTEFVRQMESVERAEEHVATMKKEIEENTELAKKVAFELEELQEQKVEEKHEEATKVMEEVTEAVEVVKKEAEAREAETKLKTEELVKSAKETEKVKEVTKAAEQETKLQSHEKAHTNKEFFREAFKKAFVVGMRDKKQKQITTEFHGVTDGYARMQLEIEQIRREKKHLEIMNSGHEGRMSRVEVDTHGARARGEADVSRLALQIDAMQNEVDQLNKDLARARRTVEQQQGERRAADAELAQVVEKKAGNEERCAELEKAVAKARAVSGEKQEGVAAAQQNRRILQQLQDDISRENDKLNRTADELGGRKDREAAAVSCLRTEIQALRQSLIDTELATQECRDDISALNGKKNVLKVRAELREKEHAELRGFASNRFFPAAMQAQILAPAWVDEDMPEHRTTDEADRVWQAGGIRYANGEKNGKEEREKQPNSTYTNSNSNSNKMHATTPHTATAASARRSAPHVSPPRAPTAPRSGRRRRSSPPPSAASPPRPPPRWAPASPSAPVFRPLPPSSAAQPSGRRNKKKAIQAKKNTFFLTVQTPTITATKHTRTHTPSISASPRFPHTHSTLRTPIAPPPARVVFLVSVPPLHPFTPTRAKSLSSLL